MKARGQVINKPKLILRKQIPHVGYCESQSIDLNGNAAVSESLSMEIPTMPVFTILKWRQHLGHLTLII